MIPSVRGNLTTTGQDQDRRRPPLRHLLDLFAGESVKIEPSLRPVQVPHISAHADAPVSGQPVTLHSGLLDRVRQTLRLKHYSHKTEEAYVGWIKRFLRFYHDRHPAGIAEKEIGQYLSALATRSRVSASTQNQALNALLFLYHEVLGKQIGYVNSVMRAKRPQRLPVVLTRDEVKALLRRLDGPAWIMATLLYGAGLRLMECCRLRVKDLDFTQNQIVVRAGKGNKDRYTMLPAAVKEPLAQHLEETRRQHQYDLERGLGRVTLPNALDRKYPQAGKEWSWQWVFPASRYYTDPATREPYRHH